MPIPEPSASHLKIIVDALKARSKSIRHSVTAHLYSVENEYVLGKENERLNLDFELTEIGSSIRFSFWEDRWIFINVRYKCANGKHFNCKIEGRLGETTGASIIEKLEDTIKYSLHHKGHNLDDRVNKVWEELIFSGPRRVT